VDKWDDEMAARLVAQLGALDLLPVSPSPGATREMEVSVCANALRQAAAEQREADARRLEEWADECRALYPGELQIAEAWREAARRLREG
jgi:hypothetical protein